MDFEITSASEDAEPQREVDYEIPHWLEIGWRGEENILYKGVETSPSQTRFKNIEEKPERKSSKRTISVLAVGLGCYSYLKRNFRLPIG